MEISTGEIETGRGTYHVELPLLGEHQIENARTAIAALEILDSFDLESGQGVGRAVRGGVACAGRGSRCRPAACAGRRRHNADSGRALCSTLRRHFDAYDDILLVVGGTTGHDMAAVVSELAAMGPRVVVTKSRHPKAVQPDDFAAAVRRDNVPVAAVTGDVASALEVAYRMAGPETLIVATGSLFVAAEVIEHVRGIEPELYPRPSRPVHPAIHS